MILKLINGSALEVTIENPVTRLQYKLKPREELTLEVSTNYEVNFMTTAYARLGISGYVVPVNTKKKVLNEIKEEAPVVSEEPKVEEAPVVSEEPKVEEAPVKKTSTRKKVTL